MIRSYWPVAAAQLVINALLLALGYYWLGLGEGSAATLLWSLLVASTIVFATLLIQGGTFVRLAGGHPGMRMLLRRVVPLLLICAALGAVYFVLSLGAGYSGRPAFRIASYLTLHLRKPVRPASVLRVFQAAFWLLRWMVVPVLALPLVGSVSLYGWKGFTAPKAAHRWWYWPAVPLLLVCALLVPQWLWGWVPHAGSFWMEAASLALRVAAGYLCFIGAWLVLVFLTASGNPRATQPSTAVSP